MVFGYTPLDPLVVLIGTGFSAYLLSKDSVRLLYWLPMALTIYFFIPLFTFLTLWQTVPLLLTLRVALKARLKVPPQAKTLVIFFMFVFLTSAFYAVLAGAGATRAIIRMIFYAGLFSLFSFAYEMGLKKNAYELFLKGLVLLGTVLALYGLYQAVAIQVGLPVRGILRGTWGSEVAFESVFLRINSLANEPKRLGYVLFVCALACLFLAREQSEKVRKLKWTGIFILFMSLFTFAGSYFLSLFLFTLVALLLYPTRATPYVFAGLIACVGIVVLLPDLGIIDSLQVGFERRLNEVEVGLDGRRVYRQEFYAWDYLGNHPVSAILGVGVGQYFSEFSRIYGTGAGLSEFGGLLPMNSNFLELTFDFGGIVAAAFYLSVATLILKLRNAGQTFLCLSLLFLLIQSLTILTIQFIVLFAGISAAQLIRGNRNENSSAPKTNMS